MTKYTAEDFNKFGVGSLPGLIGIDFISVTPELLQARTPVRPELLAPNGYLHAATVIALADTCAGYATVAHLPAGAKGFTTVELKSNFLGTAKEGRIRAECVADHLGRTTHVWSATVIGPTGRKLALFRCTQLILF